MVIDVNQCPNVFFVQVLELCKLSTEEIDPFSNRRIGLVLHLVRKELPLLLLQC